MTSSSMVWHESLFLKRRRHRLCRLVERKYNMLFCWYILQINFSGYLKLNNNLYPFSVFFFIFFIFGRQIVHICQCDKGELVLVTLQFYVSSNTIAIIVTKMEHDIIRFKKFLGIFIASSMLNWYCTKMGLNIPTTFLLSVYKCFPT